MGNVIFMQHNYEINPKSWHVRITASTCLLITLSHHHFLKCSLYILSLFTRILFVTFFTFILLFLFTTFFMETYLTDDDCNISSYLRDVNSHSTAALKIRKVLGKSENTVSSATLCKKIKCLFLWLCHNLLGDAVEVGVHCALPGWLHCHQVLCYVWSDHQVAFSAEARQQKLSLFWWYTFKVLS